MHDLQTHLPDVRQTGEQQRNNKIKNSQHDLVTVIVVIVAFP